MKRLSLWSTLGLAGAGWFLYKLLTTSSASGTVSEQFSNLVDNTMNTFVPGAWSTSDNAQKYIPYISSVESQYGIPSGLLSRMAYQESHFRDDIVSGSITSPAGAVGLMQLIPRYFPGAGQNWQTDVTTAADYLRNLFRQFDDWQLAVAAYNFGPGNVNAYLAGTKSLPSETTTYVDDVFSDVPVSGSLIDV